MASSPLLQAAPLASSATRDASFDALVVLLPSPTALVQAYVGADAAAAIATALDADAALSSGPHAPVVIAAKGAPGGRVVLSMLGAMKQDTDDARLVAESTFAAVSRAVAAGARRPLVHVVFPEAPRFARSLEVAALSALATRWVPLEAREAGKAPPTAASVGVAGLDPERVQVLLAIDSGKSLCRDITGTEPERMAPLRVATLCLETFAGSGVEVAIERDVSGYPLLAAVARASNVVERHRPCVVRLDYTPPGSIRRTVVLAGKGVTYDTGGADLKTNGHMAGMSRDKGGAGAVAGLVRAAAAAKLEGVRIVGLLGLVRNSIGEESYVSDEIIRSRAGVRVRIGNTDAEGRLVLADLLARAKEIVDKERDPLLVSIATLTGHVYRAWGPYVGSIANTAAMSKIDLGALDAIAEQWAEPMERSRPRREDYAMVAARSSAEDVVSANRLASVDTPRGHQFPFAFLDIASGLKGSGLPFVHLDIGGAAMDPPDWQFGRPTGTPIATWMNFLGEGET